MKELSRVEVEKRISDQVSSIVMKVKRDTIVEEVTKNGGVVMNVRFEERKK